MIYTAIDNFYLTDEQLEDTPSRKDGIDLDTETTLRVYGCDLIQESGILLKLPQAVMATGQVLFHRFYCKKSFGRFNVKRVAASSVWLASKLEENPRKARHVIFVFHRMECRRENLPVQHIDPFSAKYSELKNDLNRTERHLLKEMGFICHVEHPHKFICNYLATLETQELSQEAWNLANDSLRTTLCVRFKSEVIACGVVYAAARRFKVPLPENPPWWKAFDAEKDQIDEVCRVLALLYNRPKAQYISVCKDGETFASNKLWDAKSETVPKEPSSDQPAKDSSNVAEVSTGDKSVEIRESMNEAITNVPQNSMIDDKPKSVTVAEEVLDKSASHSKSYLRTEASSERNRDRERDRDRYKEKDKEKSRDRERGRDSDRDREREERERSRDKIKDKGHRSKSGHSEKSRQHHTSRERDYRGSYTSSREKDRQRNHQ